MRQSSHLRQKCDLCLHVIMEAFRVAVTFMLVQTLFVCLHLQIQLLHFVEEQRQMSARRSAILQQLLLSPKRRTSSRHRQHRRFWVQPGQTAGRTSKMKWLSRMSGVKILGCQGHRCCHCPNCYVPTSRLRRPSYGPLSVS